MKFRTEIDIVPARVKIGYENQILSLGSCFATRMAGQLAEAKFRVTANPTGTLFNPLSIAAAIEHYADPVTLDELLFDGERWFHYGFHGDFSAPSAEEALQRMNLARKRAYEALHAADRIILTLGTAWVYEHRGMVVANCHRQPASEFVRRRLSVGEIVSRMEKLVRGALHDKQIILTVSPVRHLGDTLSGNAVSKATLRLAVQELCDRSPRIDYFPAFEVLMDDLRDYRFYDEDLIHPAPQAVKYIWELFRTHHLTEQALQLLPSVEAVTAAALHRPRNPQSEAHRTFCRRNLERIASLPQIDFQTETAYFRQCLEINS